MENYGEQRSHHHCPHLGSASVRTDVFRCLLSFHTLASTCSLRHAQTWRFRPTHLPMLPLSPIIYYIAYCCRCRCSRTTTLFTKSPNNVQSKYDISLKTSFPNNFSNLFSSSSCLSSFFWLSNLSWLYNFPFNRSIHLKQKNLSSLNISLFSTSRSHLFFYVYLKLYTVLLLLAQNYRYTQFELLFFEWGFGPIYISFCSKYSVPTHTENWSLPLYAHMSNAQNSIPTAFALAFCFLYCIVD